MSTKDSVDLSGNFSGPDGKAIAENHNLAKIGFKERIGYGVGDLASNLIWTAAGTFLSFYYTDVIGLSAGAIGTLLLIARVFDGIVDLGVGALVDKTKSRYGKARPWLLWGAIPFGVAGVLLFSVPNIGATGALIYAYITYLIMNIVYSAINVPYGVLNSLLTQDSYERSLLNIYRMVMAYSGAILVTFLTMPLINLFGGGKSGWIFTFVLFAILAVASFLTTFATTKERVKPSVVQKEIPFKRAVRGLFRNKYWGLMLGFVVTFFIGFGIITGMNVYFTQYILKDSGLVGLIGMATLVPILGGLFIIAPFIKRYGKRNTAMVGSIITIVGSLIIAINPDNLSVVLTGIIIRSIGTMPIHASIFAMLADTVDYGEWKTGMRTEGLVYSAGSLGTKAGSGLGAAFIGWGLALGGYVGGQDTISSTAHTAIQFLFIYLPAIMAILQIIILWFYKLDKSYPQMIKELEAVRTN
ncbi:MFS transporter [Paenibacillus sp. FSL K6-2862]|uniref:MFS transporter n=1 Tax=Paenibacillus sp. FSL K6-2862 TaxID=2921484 RepID=UPI0030F9BE72